MIGRVFDRHPPNDAVSGHHIEDIKVLNGGSGERGVTAIALILASRYLTVGRSERDQMFEAKIFHSSGSIPARDRKRGSRLDAQRLFKRTIKLPSKCIRMRMVKMSAPPRFPCH